MFVLFRWNRCDFRRRSFWKSSGVYRSWYVSVSKYISWQTMLFSSEMKVLESFLQKKVSCGSDSVAVYLKKRTGFILIWVTFSGDFWLKIFKGFLDGNSIVPWSFLRFFSHCFQFYKCSFVSPFPLWKALACYNFMQDGIQRNIFGYFFS